MQQLLRWAVLSGILFAHVFSITPEQKWAGQLHYISIKKGQQLVDLAEQYGIGMDEILSANPSLKTQPPRPGIKLQLPTFYLLPAHTGKGIVINLPEKRLYYFPSQTKVYVFPIAIGRVHHESQTGNFSITEKRHKPSWNVPMSVWKEEKAKGNLLPTVFEPGPENPLGDYAMRLNHSAILIHGTNFPPSIGKRSTSGCFALYPKDIEELFKLVPMGTTVRVINQPIKTAQTPKGLYIESHPTLMQTQNHDFRLPYASEIQKNVSDILKLHPHLSQQALYSVFSQNLGIPILIPYEDDA